MQDDLDTVLRKLTAGSYFCRERYNTSKKAFEFTEVVPAAKTQSAKKKSKGHFYVLGTAFADCSLAADADKQPDLDDLFAELEKDVS